MCKQKIKKEHHRCELKNINNKGRMAIWGQRSSVGLEWGNKQRSEARQRCSVELWCGSETCVCMECQSPGFSSQHHNTRKTNDVKEALVKNSFLVILEHLRTWCTTYIMSVDNVHSWLYTRPWKIEITLRTSFIYASWESWRHKHQDQLWCLNLGGGEWGVKQITERDMWFDTWHCS